MRRLTRWTPLVVLALGYGLSLGGLIPRGDGHRFAVIAAGLALAILVGFEVGDSVAARKPGRAALMSACPCQMQLPEIERRLDCAERANELLVDTLAEMCERAGIELPDRPDLRVINGGLSGAVDLVRLGVAASG